MRTSTPPWPTYDDVFLQRVAQGFQRRRKAISHRCSALGYDTEVLDDGRHAYWFWTESFPRRITLQVVEGNRGHLFVQSTRAANRGKLLLRIDDMRLLDQPRKIVTAYESTMSEAHHTRTDFEAACQRITSEWRKLSLELVD